jgi:hypothetical protein
MPKAYVDEAIQLNVDDVMKNMPAEANTGQISIPR